MQVAFMLGRHQVFLELPEEMDDYEDFTEILSNSHLNTHFLSLGREVGESCLESRPFFSWPCACYSKQNTRLLTLWGTWEWELAGQTEQSVLRWFECMERTTDW